MTLQEQHSLFSKESVVSMIMRTVILNHAPLSSQDRRVGGSQQMPTGTMLTPTGPGDLLFLWNGVSRLSGTEGAGSGKRITNKLCIERDH